MLESARIMYEIYRERGYNGRARVVYFTELNEHNKESEINRAMAGTHLHDGFISEWRKDAAKSLIAQFVDRLNEGEEVDPHDLDAALEALASPAGRAR